MGDATVIIGTRGDVGALRACVAGVLEQARPLGAEVLLCCGDPLPPELDTRQAGLRCIERPGALVPVLWRDGLRATDGELVVLTIGAMVPRSGWLESLLAHARERGAVGGAIAPGAGLRLRDRAELLARYAHDLPPFQAHDCDGIPGDNCAYRREALQAVHETWADGFWEPDVNRALAQRGVVPLHSPEPLMAMGRSAGARAFVRQRLVHGRAYGRQRGARFSTGRNLAGVLAAPLVPLVLIARSLRAAPQARSLLALPWLVAFDAAWALGEALGHLDALGGGG